jgi:hypothetical protein
LNAETITHTIQFILAPVVMVSSCAILVGGMLSRYAELKDRLRALARERLDLLHGPDGNFEQATQMKDAFTAAQLCTLLMLRRSYGPYFDTFSAREMAHLRLYRWLHEAGRREG